MVGTGREVDEDVRQQFLVSFFSPEKRKRGGSRSWAAWAPRYRFAVVSRALMRVDHEKKKRGGEKGGAAPQEEGPGIFVR